MREISEVILIGNYLLGLSERFAQDSIKYETVKSLNEKVLQIVNKGSQSYSLLHIDDKMAIVKKMISSGVFKTDSSNKIAPFKQVYNYELSKSILVAYSPDGNLIFKLPKTTDENKAFIFGKIKESYANNLHLDLKNAITTVINEYKQKTSKIK